MTHKKTRRPIFTAEWRGGFSLRRQYRTPRGFQEAVKIEERLYRTPKRLSLNL